MVRTAGIYDVLASVDGCDSDIALIYIYLTELAVGAGDTGI